MFTWLIITILVFPFILQTTINDIQQQMNDHYAKNQKLREENVELANKLKSLIEQYELREKVMIPCSARTISVNSHWNMGPLLLHLYTKDKDLKVCTLIVGGVGLNFLITCAERNRQVLRFINEINYFK